MRRYSRPPFDSYGWAGLWGFADSEFFLDPNLKQGSERQILTAIPQL